MTKTQEVYTLLVEAGRAENDGLPDGAAGAASELAMGLAVAQQLLRDQPLPAAGSKAPEALVLTLAEAARQLAVSEADVQALIDAGELRAKRIGESWRIPRAALESYLDS